MKIDTFFLVTDPKHHSDELGDFVVETSLRGLVDISRGSRGFLRQHPIIFTKRVEAIDEALDRFHNIFNAVPGGPPGNIPKVMASSKHKDTTMSVDSTSDIIKKYSKIAAEGNPATTEHEEDWQAYMKKEMKSKGIDSLDDLDEEAKKKFFNEIDKEWNSKDEPGKDGEISAVIAKYRKTTREAGSVKLLEWVTESILEDSPPDLDAMEGFAKAASSSGVKIKRITTAPPFMGEAIVIYKGNATDEELGQALDAEYM